MELPFINGATEGILAVALYILLGALYGSFELLEVKVIFIYKHF